MNVLKSRTFLKVTELAVGIPFVVLLGALLHFTYEMSGHNIVVASFSAVNESFWEHLKMPFFPAVLLAVVQYARLRKDYPSFFLGKAVGIFTVPVIITVGFYSYQAIFGGHSLAYDIGLFIAAVIAGQIISYKA
ncbi:MAG: DUF6512 family protein, partial [Candidatus Caldarchaeum sp.]|nr:DUF6512 family protein [Candidatus Caldarchaeum sp.]MDW8435943.1 DUF6512 family protein [Candidatus Caldarchaeum sp.]